MQVMKVRQAGQAKHRSRFLGTVSEDKPRSCLANYVPFREEGSSFLRISFFLPFCAPPEENLSCDSVSLQLSRTPPSTSLRFYSSPVLRHLALGSLPNNAIAPDKQLAFPKSLSLTIRLILCEKFPLNSDQS